MLCISGFSKESVVNEVSDLQTSMKVDKDNTILVFGKGSLHAISSMHGEIVWKVDFPAERSVQFDVLSSTCCFLNLTHTMQLMLL